MAPVLDGTSLRYLHHPGSFTGAMDRWSDGEADIAEHPRVDSLVPDPVNTTPAKHNRRTRPSTFSRVLLGLLALVLFVVVVAQVPPSTVTDHLADTTGAAATPQGVTDSRCPWLVSAMARKLQPSALARMVVARMTLGEKVGEIVLAATRSYENANAGVPSAVHTGPYAPGWPAGGGLRSSPGDTTPPRPSVSPLRSTPRSPARTAGSSAPRPAVKGIDVSPGPEPQHRPGTRRTGVPGRAFGEDPALVTSPMGVADIEGIQAAGHDGPWPSISPSTTRRPTAAQRSTLLVSRGPSRRSICLPSRPQ